jgi:hypothetical protein
LDAKKIIELEKGHVFETFSEQLCAPRDPYDDQVMESLHHFLFWRFIHMGRTSLTESDGKATTSGNNCANISVVFKTVRTNFLSEIKEVDDIVVPQLLGSIFQLLQYSRSWDQLRYQLSCLIDFRLVHQCDTLSETNDRNIEKIFSRKDWILEISDIISAQKRRWTQSVEDSELNPALFSLSESESVGGVSVGSGANHHLHRNDYLSSGESDEASSVANDSLPDDTSPDLNRNFSNIDPVNLRAEFVERFIQPVREFLHYFIMVELVKKFSTTRRWYELFRLSSPEVSHIQEELLYQLLKSVESVPFITSNVETTGFNFLKNFSHLLEQTLEKVSISLSFCVAAIQALQTLNYRCSLELRAFVKDTVLREVRNQLIVRCIVEVGQDLHDRVTAVVDIESSLQAYLSQPETKLLTEFNVSIILFGMCFDILENAQHLHDASILSSSSVASAMKASRMIESPISFGLEDDIVNIQHSSADYAQYLKASIECMVVLVGLIQNICQCSAECHRNILKLIDNLVHDPDHVCVRVFTRDVNEIVSPRQSLLSLSSIETSNSSKGNATSSGAVASSTMNRGSLGSQGQKEKETTSSWWLGWGLASSSSASTVPTNTASATVNTNSVNTARDSLLLDDSNMTSPSLERDIELGGKQSPLPVEISQDTNHGESSDNTTATNVSNIRDAKSFVLWFCKTDNR